jgi:hypothetical protein
VFIPIPAAFHQFFLPLHWCIVVDRPLRADRRSKTRVAACDIAKYAAVCEYALRRVEKSCYLSAPFLHHAYVHVGKTAAESKKH